MPKTKIDLNPSHILGTIMASTFLLGVLIIEGLFALGTMFYVLSNVLFIVLVFLVVVVLYRMNALNLKSIILTGVATGFLAWIVLLTTTVSALSWIASIPIIGLPIYAAVAGGLTIVLIFTNLLGSILAGVLLAGIIGGLLLIFDRSR